MAGSLLEKVRGLVKSDRRAVRLRAVLVNEAILGFPDAQLGSLRVKKGREGARLESQAVEGQVLNVGQEYRLTGGGVPVVLTPAPSKE